MEHLDTGMRCAVYHRDASEGLCCILCSCGMSVRPHDWAAHQRLGMARSERHQQPLTMEEALVIATNHELALIPVEIMSSRRQPDGGTQVGVGWVVASPRDYQGLGEAFREWGSLCTREGHFGEASLGWFEAEMLVNNAAETIPEAVDAWLSRQIL